MPPRSARRGTPPGKRIRCLSSPKDGSRWASAPDGRGSAAEVADTVSFAMMPNEPRETLVQLVRDFDAVRGGRDVELALHVPVIGDIRAAFMAPPDIDVAALRAMNSLAVLPSD